MDRLKGVVTQAKGDKEKSVTLALSNANDTELVILLEEVLKIHQQHKGDKKLAST